jgi:hypothetical protein
MNREGKPSDELTGKESSSESKPDASGVTAPALFPIVGNVGTSGEQEGTIPEQVIAPEAKPTNNGSRVSVGEQFPPTEKQDPNQGSRFTTQKALPARARRGGDPPIGAMSQRLLLILRREADSSFQRYLGGITNEITEYLLDRQKLVPDPILLERGYVLQWAARYWGAVRRAALCYAGALAQSIGLKKGLGPGDIRWISREVGGFFRQQLMGDKAANFLTESSNGVAEIQAPEVADSYFRRALARYAKAPLLMRLVREELSRAQELYGRTKKLAFRSGSFEPTPSEMVANPPAHPLMTAKQVRQVIPVSRSTADAWANDGTLDRVGPEEKHGKRGRLLVSTESVKKLMDKRKD